MTVVHPNHIVGINSITVQTGQALNIHDASGNLIRNITSSSGVSTFSSLHVGAGTTTSTQGISVGTGCSIVSTTANQLELYTNNVERLRITSAGDFGTGGVTPTTQSGRVFHLHAPNQQRFHMTNNTTGSSATDGFEIIVEEGANVRIRNFEAGALMFDSGGPDNEAFRIDSGGKLLVGTTSDVAPDSFGSLLQVDSGGAGGSIALGRHTASGSGPILIFHKSRSGSGSGNTVVADGDALGGFRFYGADGTDRNSYGANISVEVDGTPGSNDMPGRIIFATTSDGAASSTERLRITSTGTVQPGADATQDLGSISKRWANIYSADLQLSNEGSENEVDGTWGNYTIQEGESDLFLINRRNGKKYKFNLTEVS